jgi:ribonucleoside-diphosphate reductase beta chain
MYLKNNNNLTKRYSIFPVLHNDIWQFYKKAESQTWVAEEIDLSKDKFTALKPSEQLYLKNILAFFTISDGLVIDNLCINFINEVDIMEAQFFYGHQIFIEQIHSNGYALLIEAYIKDAQEKDDLFNAMETNLAVSKKADWAENWIAHPSFSHRLVAFACVEGISFSSVFAGVFWFRSRNAMMDGLCGMNELILRDETSHYEFALYLYRTYLKDEYKLSPSELSKIILSCYEVEEVFINESMPDGLAGLTKDMMIEYVQYVCDIVLNDFGCEVYFKVNNPLEYMSRIGLSSKNNFFEQRVGEYTRIDIPNDSSDIFNDVDF